MRGPVLGVAALVALQFFLRLNYLDMHRTYGCAANPQRTRPLCDFCGRKFCQPQKLKVHIKRMHSGEFLKLGWEFKGRRGVFLIHFIFFGGFSSNHPFYIFYIIYLLEFHYLANYFSRHTVRIKQVTSAGLSYNSASSAYISESIAYKEYF